MRTFAALALLLALSQASSSSAQRDPGAASARRSGWLPRSTRLGPELTTAEKTTILRRLDEIERLVLQVPELAQPEGFEVLPTVYANAMEIWPVIQGHPRGSYVVQSYQLRAFRPSKAIAGEGLTCLEIIVNPLPPQVYMDYAMNDVGDGKGDRVYIENRFGARKPGALLAYGHILPGPGGAPPANAFAERFSPTNISLYSVFFSADGVSPWLEVTRWEYLETMIWDGETRHLKEIERMRQSRTKTRYEQWVSRTRPNGSGNATKRWRRWKRPILHRRLRRGRKRRPSSARSPSSSRRPRLKTGPKTPGRWRTACPPITCGQSWRQ